MAETRVRGGIYLRKPEHVEAMQYRVEDGMDNVRTLSEWGVSFYGERAATGAMRFWIAKSSAWGFVRPGDWIIKESDGKGFYPCTADAFTRSYSEVQHDD